MSVSALPVLTVEASNCAVGPVGSDGYRACVGMYPDALIEVRQHPAGMGSPVVALDETYLLEALAGGAWGVLLVGCPGCLHPDR